MRRKISWTDRGKTVYPPPPPKGGGGYNYKEYLKFLNRLYLYNLVWNSLLFSYLKFLNRLYDITWFGLFTFNKRPKPGYIV